MNHLFLNLLNDLLHKKNPSPSFVLYPNEEEINYWKLETPDECLKSLGYSLKFLDDIFVPQMEDYSVSEITTQLHHFLSTHSLHLSKKIVWWPCVKSFPLALQNKLLKFVEDGGIDYVFLFWIFRPVVLLPTFQSRTIKLKNLFPQTSIQVDTHPAWELMKHASFADFQVSWEKNQWSEKYILNEISKKLLATNNSKNSFVYLEKFGSLVDWVNKSSQWNNPLLERKYMLFQFLRPFMSDLKT